MAKSNNQSWQTYPLHRNGWPRAEGKPSGSLDIEIQFVEEISASKLMAFALQKRSFKFCEAEYRKPHSSGKCKTPDTLFGGNWNNGAKCGPFYLNLNNAPSNVNVNVGLRLDI